MKRHKWVIAVFLLNLALRLCFINWHPATYTDSIDYLTALERIRGTIILPAYPFAVVLARKLFGDPQFAGRLVSILAASLAVFPLYGLARIVFDRRAALLTILLYSVSPLIFRWSLRIFPHGLYSLFLLLFLYGIFKSVESGKAGYLAAGIFCGGLAVLTYPTGLILVPVALASAVGCLLHDVFREGRGRTWGAVWLAEWAVSVFLFYFWGKFQSFVSAWFSRIFTIFPVRLPGPPGIWEVVFLGVLGAVLTLLIIYFFPSSARRRGWWYRRPAVVLLLLLSFTGYLFLHVWLNHLAGNNWYLKGMESSWKSVPGRWETWLTHYLASLPYVLFYPVALFAALGLIITVVRPGKKSRQWYWLAFYLYFFAGIFYTLVVNKWWTPRYQYSLVPLSLIWAGYGLSWLWGTKKLKWVGVGSFFLCFLGSALFTGLVLYWSRDSFGDIRRSAAYIRDRLQGKRVFSSELRKVGFWSQTPLQSYTRQSRSRVQPGDLVLLVGWHTNLQTELAYLNRFYETEIVHREKSEIVPLLADDIVDWAGKKLRRRANAPVVWEERFRKQRIESWLVEIKARRGQAETENISAGEAIGVSSRSFLTSHLEHATYFDVGVWEVLLPAEKGEVVRLEMAHPRAGKSGSFHLVAYADRDGDGLPDETVARSPLLESAASGEWSGWEFPAPGGKLFVGSAWELGNWVYYERGGWPHRKLGEVMYYSRGGLPKNKAYPVMTNLKISFPGREAEKQLD